MPTAQQSLVKLILTIEVEGTYSRSSPCFDYDGALESNGNQSVGRLEVTVSEADNGEGNSPPLKTLHHSVIEDPTERIKPHEVLLSPPSFGTYITTFWSSSLSTEVELPKPPLYFLNVTETGVEIGGTIFTWRDIENNANWPHEDDVATYVNGELAPWDEDVWNAIVSSDDYCVRVLGPILLAELGFLVGHGRLESGLTCPTQITREALTRPDVLQELALSMPWEYARRIMGPAELTWWLEANHPQAPSKESSSSEQGIVISSAKDVKTDHNITRLESTAPEPANSSPEDLAAAQAVEELKQQGYPKTDYDPGNGETFPVYPEDVICNRDHPLYDSLPDNARPENWREMESAEFNPSKAESIHPRQTTA